jgi:hypothetical protein
MKFIMAGIFGFSIGNSLYFLLNHGDANFISYTMGLFKSQLEMPQKVIGYLDSPAWSWFTVPQIFTMYRVDWLKSVESVFAFQNPIFFLITLPTIAYSIYALFKNKKEKSGGVILILLFFVSEYVPWLFNVHMTFYYYVIPLIPLIIILFLILVEKFKNNAFLLRSMFLVSVLIFTLYYPLMVGFLISKRYDLLLYKYNLYNFTERDTLFCQHCSPHQ